MENASRGGIALVGFDADDTLWRSQDYFDEAQAQFERIISRHVDLADVGRRLYEYEARNIAFFGYGVKGMALSMVEAAVDITGGRIPGADIKRIVCWPRSCCGIRWSCWTACARRWKRWRRGIRWY